jgi:pilus assembly protein CpaD
MSHVFIDTHGRIRARAFRLSLLAAPWIALSLGGCAVDRTVTGTVPGPNYKETHPIEMVESPTTLDVYPAATHMDRETHLRLKEFATGFHANGIGQIEILMPQGAPNSAHLQNALPAIRKSLAAGGATGYVSVGTYPPKSEESAPPIRLAYRTLHARVPHACGDFPDDIATGSSVHGWRNTPYWNYGCSYQNTFAMQVADPRDLVNPRAEAPADLEMRRLRIEKVRNGQDPGATWKTSNSNIGSVGN